MYVASQALALLIGCFSGLWPYTKLLMMLCLWCLPSWVLPAPRRGRVLMALDNLGKWSFLDLYVLAQSMLGFQIAIDSPTDTYMPEGIYRVTLQCTPVWGLYAFVMAVVSSLLLSHVMLIAHRNVAAWDEQRERPRPDPDPVLAATPPKQQQQLQQKDAAATPPRGGHRDAAGPRTPTTPATPAHKGRERRSSAGGWLTAGTADVLGPRAALVHHVESVRAHVFSLGEAGEAAARTRRRGSVVGFGLVAQLALSLLLLLSMAILLLGVSLPSFGFRTDGLVGIAIDAGRPGNSVRQYSVLSAFMGIGGQGRPETYMGIYGTWAIAFVFLAVAFLAPMLQLLLGLAIWVVPLTLRQQKKLFLALEIAGAWAGLPVFLVGARKIKTLLTYK